MTTAVSINNLAKSYGSQVILSGINLDIQPGEFLGLVGVNGAGKTTLIKCLLDFTQVDAGSISIFGTEHTLNLSREQLVFLPEKFIPPYYLSARDFLVYMHKLHGSDYNHDLVEEIFRVLDLDPVFIDRSVGQLSKGMSQKLGIAACLLSNRELLVMDEPMSGLDPRARAYLKRHLLDLKQRGRTLFFSTHMLNDVETLCDKVAVLHEGKLKFVGSPMECCTEHDTDDFEQAYLRCVGEEKGNASQSAV